MVKFKIETKVVTDNKNYMKNKNEYDKKFHESVSIYLKHMLGNNYNVKEIELDKEEWNDVENALPRKYNQDDNIFIKDNVLCLENSGFINEIRTFLPETCKEVIIKTKDMIYIRPVDTDSGMYIDEYVVNMIKEVVCKRTLEDRMFEFFEPTLNWHKVGLRWTTIERMEQ